MIGAREPERKNLAPPTTFTPICNLAQWKHCSQLRCEFKAPAYCLQPALEAPADQTTERRVRFFFPLFSFCGKSALASILEREAPPISFFFLYGQTICRIKL